MKKINQGIKIGNKITRNRVVMPAMDTLMAKNGVANEFHVQHYGARAYGGVGLIIVESTAISEEGRIRDKDLGIWNDEQVNSLKHVSKIAKTANALIGIQLNHAGSKAELQSVTFGVSKKYEYLNQSDLKMLSLNDYQKIEDMFVEAAKRAKEAGFDFLEIHAAHGYLLNEILNPYLNDVDLENDILRRGAIVIRIVKRIFDEVKIPIGIRFSISDHEEGKMTPKDYEPLIKVIDQYLAYINISSGASTKIDDMRELINEAGTKLIRLPLAKQVREMTNITLIAGGNVSTRNDIDAFLENDIDGVYLGREIIFQPNLVLTTLLETNEIDENHYHWNKNIWFSPLDYKKLKDSL